MTVTFLRDPATAELVNHGDRLDPAQLHADATWLLQRNDPHELVVALLKQVRENDDRQNAIRDGYSASCRSMEERATEAEQERNEYREALRGVRRAVRGLRLGRP